GIPDHSLGPATWRLESLATPGGVSRRRADPTPLLPWTRILGATGARPFPHRVAHRRCGRGRRSIRAHRAVVRADGRLAFMGHQRLYELPRVQVPGPGGPARE